MMVVLDIMESMPMNTMVEIMMMMVMHIMVMMVVMHRGLCESVRGMLSLWEGGWAPAGSRRAGA